MDRPLTEKQAHIINTTTQHPNLSLREIAALTKSDHAHVLRTLERYGIKRDELEGYKTHRADILAGLQHKILSKITEGDIEKASLLQKLSGYGILTDKERLERGQNDANIKPLIQINIGGRAVDKPVDNLYANEISNIEIM